jgi:hypothetical protein
MNGIDKKAMPIACSLTSAEFRERESSLLAQFRSAVEATEELADGYAFHLPGDRRTIALLAELFTAERECCPFLTFELHADPNQGPLLVRITGSAGAKEFVRTIFYPPSNGN